MVGTISLSNRTTPRRVHQGSEFDVGVSQSTLSHHVKILREAGIVQNDPEGTRCLLSLRTVDLEKRFPGLVDSLGMLVQGAKA
ncbi:ArsR/SmtB family transcription factor [Microbacterium aurugineum]|uniref:Helix-turn-helix domain-containing protein n=1 Tax=Microbacterium aurugineum TaxID=2851642 RepID=A0ABY4IY14_9MICO|nr:helix-turn-helix domain-containing protein [Microbacterium aurugineum]UPL16686.1 helix-turn-helix domain-containing protein [Microbacterium aurugineum]